MKERMTKAQRKALTKLWLRCLDVPRGTNPLGTLREFHRSAAYYHSVDCVMVAWCGMMVGIERDGYTHT